MRINGTSLKRQISALQTAIDRLPALPPAEPTREELEADLARAFATPEVAAFLEGAPASQTIWRNAQPGYDDELGDRFREILRYWLAPPEEREAPALTDGPPEGPIREHPLEPGPDRDWN